MKILFLIIIISGFFWNSIEVHAKAVVSHVNLASYYNTYQNIALSENANLIQLAPSISFVISAHLVAMFNFQLEVEQTLQDESLSADNALSFPTYKGLGFGFQVDFPGFFFIGARIRDLVQTGKKYPFNTFGYATAMRMSKVNRNATAEQKSVVSKMGLGMDAFLFNQAGYLTIRLGTGIFAGDAFSNLAIGLGVNF